mmetsp:Transcript_21209/g.59043  ORF Transcript_21209/g.59043 Transcript_21209/m.59043 type:complete len:218 (-) Transcript_21209:325-978(-)
MWSSSGRKSKKKGSASDLDTDTIRSMFQELAEEDDPSVAGMEGICKLCEKLDLDPVDDIRVLVLLWKLGSEEKPGQITSQEWEDGCEKLRTDSIEKFKEVLPSLDPGFMDRAEFKDFYKFCFQFNRQGTHRTLDKSMVTALLEMALKDRIPSERLETFCKFLEVQKSYTLITLDQWTSFLDFCYECEDLSTYDESTSAWPVLLDEYVDYMEEQQKKK